MRSSPFTETPVEGVHSVVYKVGIEPIPFAGDSTSAGALGTFERGLHRVSGFVFSYHGSVAEEMFAITSEIDLIVRYRAGDERRARTFSDVIFLGDASVTVPASNRGVSELIGVPFRVQIPSGNTIANHVTDAADT